MKYTSFEINGYRAIDQAIVKVGNSLIPVIGINESGKTTVLQAILAFDKDKDRYNGGQHLVHKNRFEVGDKECQIIADVLIDSESELDEIALELKLEAGSDIYKALRDCHQNQKAIRVARTFPSKSYSVLNSDLKPDKQKGQNLALAVLNRMPFILYFDDFSDRVPDKISFTLTDEEESGYQIPKTRKNIEWHLIIEEIFKRSINGMSLKDFLKNDDLADQQSIINDIQDHLQEQVVEDWKNLKTKFAPDIGEESVELKIKLNQKIADNKKSITFSFVVEDRSNKKGRTFNVTERSKGFQWFFNFIMKLKFNPKYKSDLKGAIYLLDEPGSYLHNSAQVELLKKLKDISNTNTILYCTHSEYLLDPEEINIANILIANMDSGVITITPINSAKSSRAEGAFAPLYKALHMKSGFYQKDVEYPVVTEGVTDFYLFSMVQKFRKEFIRPEISFIPGAGATTLKDLISNAIAFSKNYLVLLDSDDEGRKAYETYRNYFGEEEAKSIFTHKIPSKSTDVVLEDFLSDPDRDKLKKIVDTEDVKMAIPKLFYSEESVKKEFIETLSPETMKNMEVVKGKVNALII